MLIKKKKNCPTQSTWVGLDPYNELDWVGFFLTYHDRLVRKNSSTQPMHTLTIMVHLVIYMATKVKKVGLVHYHRY